MTKARSTLAALALAIGSLALAAPAASACPVGDFSGNAIVTHTSYGDVKINFAQAHLVK